MIDQTLLKTNSMPAPTWHRLNLNNSEIEIPLGLVKKSYQLVNSEGSNLLVEEKIFEAALEDLQIRTFGSSCPKSVNIDTSTDPSKQSAAAVAGLDYTELSKYQINSEISMQRQSVALDFQTGAGADTYNYLRDIAADKVSNILANDAVSRADVSLEAQSLSALCAAIDVVVAENCQLDLNIHMDSQEDGHGLLGCSLRVFVSKNAHCNINIVQTLDPGWIVIDDCGAVLDEGATIDYKHGSLGGQKCYSGYCCDLRGDKSESRVQSRFLGTGDHVLDYNYIQNHRGKLTNSSIQATGALSGNSKRLMRGTIDFINGCSGAEASEAENVLLADEGVHNSCVPSIMCSEDDVCGNHGATIGHILPEQEYYLSTRGFGKSEIEALFLRSNLEETLLHAQNSKMQQSILKLGHRLFGDFDCLATFEDIELMDDSICKKGCGLCAQYIDCIVCDTCTSTNDCGACHVCPTCIAREGAGTEGAVIEGVQND